MTHTLAKSSNNDIFLIGGQLAMSEGRAAYAVIIDSAIKTQRGELQLNVIEGIPYFETVFQSPVYAEQWKANVERRINSFPFVVSISSFEYEIDFRNHVLKYDVIIETDLGSIEVNDINFKTSTISAGGGEGGDMANLIQNGEFYLPVYIENGVQVYRKLTQYVSEEIGVTTELSTETYVKDGSGNFILQT